VAAYGPRPYDFRSTEPAGGPLCSRSGDVTAVATVTEQTVDGMARVLISGTLVLMLLGELSVELVIAVVIGNVGGDLVESTVKRSTAALA
jgi:hypothetical protein